MEIFLSNKTPAVKIVPKNVLVTAVCTFRNWKNVSVYFELSAITDASNLDSLSIKQAVTSRRFSCSIVTSWFPLYKSVISWSWNSYFSVFFFFFFWAKSYKKMFTILDWCLAPIFLIKCPKKHVLNTTEYESKGRIWTNTL